jgi:hypothetical protein
MNKLNLIANIISIIAGAMTILGISGIVGWSLFGKDRGPLQRKIAAVFAFSLKTAFCMILLVLIGGPAFVVYAMTIEFFGGGFSTANAFWDPAKPVAYLVAYLFITLLFDTSYLILCSCIYEWSLGPFRRLRRGFRKEQ